MKQHDDNYVAWWKQVLFLLVVGNIVWCYLFGDPAVIYPDCGNPGPVVIQGILR